MGDYNTVIRIHSDFTEVREEYEFPSQFTVTFNLEDYKAIVKDSIELEGIHVVASSSECKNAEFEGETIYSKDQENKYVAAKYAQSVTEDMQFQNDNSEIIRFFLERPGKATLVYCYKAIYWYPKYRLDFEENNSKLKGIAIICNQSNRDFYVKAAQLTGGDIKIVQHGNFFDASSFRPISTTKTGSELYGQNLPTVAQGVERGGIFIYEIRNKLHLRKRSQIELSFITPKIDVTCFSSATNMNNSDHIGKFDRILELCSREFIPRGKLSVREKGNIIGFIDLDDVITNEKKEICIGKDAAAFYERKTKLVKTEKNSAPTIEVTVVLHNEHDKPWKLRYMEFINANFMNVNIEATSDEIDLINGGLKIICALEKQSTKTFTYTIT